MLRSLLFLIFAATSLASAATGDFIFTYRTATSTSQVQITPANNTFLHFNGSGQLVTGTLVAADIPSLTATYATAAQGLLADSALQSSSNLNADKLASGTVPDARFPSTLPALSGANLTALNASNLASGTVPDARFPATLPALSGVNLTALNANNLGSGTIPDARFPATLPASSGVNLTALNASNLGSGTVPAARLPAPGASTLGGVKRNTGTGGQYISGIDTDGSLIYGTPAGAGDANTSSSLAQFAATTSAQLRGVMSDETGTGALVFAGGAIGAATATSINGLTITSSTGTLTVANGKTLTVNNSITLSGGNGVELDVGSGGSLGPAAFAAGINVSGASGIDMYDVVGSGGSIGMKGSAFAAANSGSITLNGGSATGAHGGNLYTYGGSATSATGGSIITYGGATAGGSIDTHGSTAVGGSITTAGAANAGGSINTSGGSAGSGGSINTSGGASANGGGINTSNGGGSIITSGSAGQIGLGVSATRSIIYGAGTSMSLTLPSTSGTVGQELISINAGQGETTWSPGPVYLSSNFTTTSNSSTDTALTFSIGAFEVWIVDFQLTTQCSSTGGVKYRISAPTSATVEGWIYTSTSTITTDSRQRFTAINTLTSTAAHTVANTPGPDIIRIVVMNAGNAGSVALGIASGTNTQTSTVFAGSYMRPRRIN